MRPSLTRLAARLDSDSRWIDPTPISDPLVLTGRTVAGVSTPTLPGESTDAVLPGGG